MSLQAKRHYKLLVLLPLVALVLILGLGDQRITAYTVQGDEQVTRQVISYGDDVALLYHTALDSMKILVADAGL